MDEPFEDYADVIGRLLVRVYEIHERVLAKGGGGLEGLRDAAMLHAAVARPFTTFSGAELYPTDFDKAAALFHSLIKSHPFMDGTKRTAFASAMYFLHERGYMLRRPLPKEDLKPGVKVKGIVPGQIVSVVDVKWHGSSAVELFYKRADGRPGTQLLFRHDEPHLEVVQAHRTWAFNADGNLFRLVAEAYRIRLAHLFDPVLAVHTSLIEPLPHQITGVYGEMLPRQPLRFLLADDPGAGKTIMAGLLIKELVIRGDVRRCLICVPGNLAAQWQDELWFKFQLHFDIPLRRNELLGGMK